MILFTWQCLAACLIERLHATKRFFLPPLVSSGSGAIVAVTAVFRITVVNRWFQQERIELPVQKRSAGAFSWSGRCPHPASRKTFSAIRSMAAPMCTDAGRSRWWRKTISR